MSQAMKDAIDVAHSKLPPTSPEVRVLAEHIGSLVRMTNTVAVIINGDEKDAVRKTFYLTLRAWACDLVGPTAIPSFHNTSNYVELVNWIASRLCLSQDDVARVPS